MKRDLATPLLTSTGTASGKVAERVEADPESETVPVEGELGDVTALTERTDTVRGRGRIAGRGALRSALRRGLSRARMKERKSRADHLRRAMRGPDKQEGED